MIEALNIISALFTIASASYIIYFVRLQNSYNHSIINANRSRTPNITKPEMQKPDFIPPAQNNTFFEEWKENRHMYHLYLETRTILGYKTKIWESGLWFWLLADVEGKKIEVTSMTIADAQLGLEKEIKKYLKEKK